MLSAAGFTARRRQSGGCNAPGAPRRCPGFRPALVRPRTAADWWGEAHGVTPNRRKDAAGFFSPRHFGARAEPITALSPCVAPLPGSDEGAPRPFYEPPPRRD